MDVNKTTHIGTASTNPTFTTLGNKKTPISIFTLKVKESWLDRDGNEKSRDNLIKIEALGSKAHWVKANVRAGKRYSVDGYIRQEEINGKEDTKVRVFHIEAVRNKEFEEGRYVGMRETLKKTLNIVESSGDLKMAGAKIGVLIDEL